MTHASYGIVQPNPLTHLPAKDDIPKCGEWIGVAGSAAVCGGSGQKD